MNLLILPGAPYFALAVALASLAAIAVLRLEQARLALVGVRSLPTRWGMHRRFLVGQAAALPIVAVLLLLAVAAGTAGYARLLMFVSALASYLYIGVVLPRKPVVEAQKERRKLRQLTPGFVAFVRVSLAGYDPPAVVLERYITRPDARRAVMQAVVTEALDLMRAQRTRPFAALKVVARARGCQELTDVAESLAQAESEGSDPQAALLAQETTLLAMIEDEFKRMLKRRTMYLLVMVAVSVVIGILVNLLWVMVGSVFLSGGVAL